MTKSLQQRAFCASANDQQVFVAPRDSSHEIYSPLAIILDYELPRFGYLVRQNGRRSIEVNDIYRHAREELELAA
jgi:hypothetical protein